MTDETLFASTITNNLLGVNPSGSATNGTSSSVSLSTGDIAGIAVAGAVAIIACVAIVSIACVRVRRKKEQPAPPGTDADPNSPQPQPGYAVSPMSAQDAKPAPPAFHQQQYAYEMPVAEPQELPGGGVAAGPEGAAKLAKYAGRDGAAVPVAEMPDTAYEARLADQGQGQWDGQHEQLTPPPGQGQLRAVAALPRRRRARRKGTCRRRPSRRRRGSWFSPPQHERYTPLRCRRRGARGSRLRRRSSRCSSG